MTSRVTYNTNGTDVLIDRIDGDMTETITKQLVERMRELSPVDTGDYRAGWRYEIDQNVGLITNDDLPVEKLRALEDGSSSQAPQGIARPAVAEFEGLMEQYIRNIN